MKKIVYVIIGLIAFGFIFFLFSNKQIDYYMRQSFYSDASVIMNSFEYEVMSGEYNARGETRYVTLDKIDVNVSHDTFDLGESYVAFRQVDGTTSYSLTLIGKGKYSKYAYINVDGGKLSNLSNISSNKNININTLLKSIHATAY